MGIQNSEMFSLKKWSTQLLKYCQTVETNFYVFFDIFSSEDSWLVVGADWPIRFIPLLEVK